MQSHKLKEEFWYLISGKIKVTISRGPKSLKKKILKEEECVKISKKLLHRAERLDSSKILEISTGKFKENDEIRHKDKYKKESPKWAEVVKFG